MRTSLLYLLFSVGLLLALSQQSAQAQYILGVSSFSENVSAHTLTGTSSTQMDYNTQAYYISYVKGYIYTTNPSAPLVTNEAGNASNGIASVSSQITGTTPGSNYNLRTEHFYYPIYPSCTYPGSCNKYDYYGYYVLQPSVSGVTQNGASRYFVPPNVFYQYASANYLWLGNTNTSIRTSITVSIANNRVSGNLVGTTQNALIGADVAFAANGTPTGGSYSWSFTGSPTIISGAANQASVGVRWTQGGLFRGTINYTQGGNTVVYFIDVNVTIPALTNFSGTMVADQLKRDQGCSLLPGVTYTLGCAPTTIGMSWTSTTSIPAVAYLSNPSQSGVKFVQAVSTFSQRLRDGNTECHTARNAGTCVASGWQSEECVASGWQLDTTDPYNLPTDSNPPRYFSEGNTLVMSSRDSPGETLEYSNLSVDAFTRSDQFETYLVYFTGNPFQPTFQKTLALQGSGFPYSRIAWNWGGLARFDYSATPQLYRLLNSFTNPDVVSATGTNSLKSITTNAAQLQYQTCAGTEATTNLIDGSWFYVGQMYIDFLGRNPDTSGWNFWRSNITPCNFDLNCIRNKRVDVARAFFYSGEFVGAHPDLAGVRGNHTYNYNFVFACYQGFLRREPNDPPDNGWDGFNYWVRILDSTNPDAGDGKYNNILNAFLQSPEYRGRDWGHETF